jgi:hypothetical protein
VNGNYFLKSIPWIEAYKIKEFKYNLLQHSPTQVHTHKGQGHGRDSVTCATSLVRHHVLILYNNVVCKGAYTVVSSQKSSTGQERQHMKNHIGFYVVTKVPGPVRSLEGGALEGMSPRVFLNLRRTHKYWNLPLCKQVRLHVNNNATAHFLWRNNLDGQSGKDQNKLKML